MQGTSVFSRHDMIVLSSNLEKRFNETLNDADPTQPKTVANQLNQLFPNLESFANAPNVLKEITTDMNKMEQELRQLMLKKAASQELNIKLMDPVKAELEQLQKTCESIQSRAKDCQTTVLSITSDIQRLDRTKKNLNSSIQLLARIKKSALILQQLRKYEQIGEYKSMHLLMEKLIDISAPLKAYHEIIQIKTLVEQIKDFQELVGREIQLDFERALLNGTIPGNEEKFRSAFELLSIFESDYRSLISNLYLVSILEPYKVQFAKNNQCSSMKHIKDRFQWLGKALIKHQEMYEPLFPKEWNEEELLVTRFCGESNIMVTDWLKANESESSFSAVDMVLALMETRKFETERLNNKFKDKDYEGSISSAFDPFLWHYIEYCDQGLDEKFKEYQLSLGIVEEGVYATCIDLILVFQRCISECRDVSLSLLPNLCGSIKSWLAAYNSLMLNNLRQLHKTDTILDVLMVESKDVGEKLHTACSILNTAEYCKEVTGQFEDYITEITLSKANVDFSTEAELFLATIAESISLLVEFTSAETHLDNIEQVKWHTIRNTSDQSPYVTGISQSLAVLIPLIRSSLKSPPFFKMFCDKFAEYIRLT